MESQSVYIPMDRRLALSQDISLPDRTHGAALFADISGFTPLTEALLKLYGPKRGAEELTSQLNLIYDALVTEVHRYGGSIMAFSGDAITCWLDGDNGLRAVACGLDMQQAMTQFAAIKISANRSLPLAMKVAVAVGPVRRFQVGDPTVQYIDALAGVTLDRMTAAEHLAEKGEVVVGPEVLAQIGHELVIKEQRYEAAADRCFGVVSQLSEPYQTQPSHSPPIDLPNLTEAKVRPWLIPPVYDRLAAGKGEFLAELRSGAALFLSFKGIDYDQDEDAGLKLDAYIRWVQHVLVRYEAYLFQLTIGDKGSYLYAAFGAPVAHEDDAKRAVLAALELQDLPPELNYIQNVQIGISQGQMRTGAYGGVRRRTYGVLGDEVNLAARLMQAAQPGQILVSDNIYQATAAHFSWGHLAPIKVKGKTEPITIYSVTGRTIDQATHLKKITYALPMVGRQHELKLMEEKLGQALAGHGQIVAVIAEAGMGKSRLVAEIIEKANDQELVGYGGECQSYGTNISYLVWQSIWRAFFNLNSTWPVADQVRELEAQLKLIAPELIPRLPLLGAVLNLPIPDNDLTQSFDAKLRKTSLESMLVDLLRANAQLGPLFFVLEDCHWLDSLSQDLLDVIGRAIADLPILLVMAYRPAQIERLKEARLEKLACFTEIQLTDFTPDETEHLISLKLQQFFQNQSTVPPGLFKTISARAQGNPFYVEELVNYLHDQNFDLHNDAGLEQLELPTSLHSLILSRIDQLSEHQKSTIKVASVVGRLFPAAWLWGMYPELGDPEQIRADLEALSRLELAPMDKPEPELTYIFRHIATQEVAYESLPYAMRAILHDQLAQFIEHTYTQELDQYINLLAFHYDQSQNQAKKREYLRKAGTLAQTEYANEAAISYYQRTLPLLPLTERVPVMLNLGEVLALIGQYDEALTYYASVQHLTEQAAPINPQLLAEIYHKIAMVYHRRSEYDLALDALNKGLSYLNESIPTIQAAHLYNLRTLIYRHQGKNEEALDWCQKSLHIISKIKTHEGQQAMAHTYFNMGAIYWRRGELTEAIYFCQESVNLYQQLDDIVGLSNAYLNLSNVFADQGDWEQAGDALRQGLTLKQQVGDIYGQGMMANNLGYLHLDRGEWAEAATLFEQCHTIWQQLGATRDEANTLSNLAQVRIYQQDWSEAYACLGRSQKLFTEIGSEEFLPELERRWGEYYLGVKALDEALFHARRSIDLAVAQEFSLDEGMSYRTLGQIYLARNETELAETALRQSLLILNNLSSEFEAAKTVLVLMGMVTGNSLAPADQAHLAQAIKTFGQLNAQANLTLAQNLAHQFNLKS